MIPSYLYLCSFPTGSNYICNPPVTDTDIDTMYLVSDLNIVWSELEKMGWKRSGISEYPVDSDDWFSCRNGIYNALITNNQKYFDDFFKATQEAKRLNLTKKEDRIALFTKMCNREPKKAKVKPKYKLNWDELIPVMADDPRFITTGTATF